MYKKFVSIMLMMIAIIMLFCNVVIAAKTWNEYDVSEYENATDMETVESYFNDDVHHIDMSGCCICRRDSMGKY